MAAQRKIAIIVGTRPEAIKLAPVALAFRGKAEAHVVATGQHRDMAGEALATFGVSADRTLDTMVAGQSLGQLFGRLVAALDVLFADEAYSDVIVQGDTTSAMAAAIVGHYRGLRVSHVEAGLRSFNKQAPFPEEVHRRVIAPAADLHFPPTERARANLLAEGIAEGHVLVTGNTVVDAVRLMRAQLAGRSEVAERLGVPAEARLILLTSHRREAFGGGLSNICAGVRAVVDAHADVHVVYPVHPNPVVRETVAHALADHPRIHLIDPLGYVELMGLIGRATLVLSDSGGLQEEAPSFDKPILILRDTTERPEVLEAGCGVLVGTDAARIAAEAARLLRDEAAYAAMAAAPNPFGDGHASERIVERLLREPDR
ncbi:non-hydrolyzing UDP-N-acetylglucosamine 2-epimerase [Sphingomonas jatrophae]|uniref:UDP-N-acetylglucosamine 2-epimerase (non-hydrolyzing) n=1 Tax=Sphingomonas jatrophae TaxID=1166337 RepID=A0A1I6L3V9_9SPHN|nr:UDP-N-acetylglucosamine 2-epimerase (non-hydrolyzing) [Sphingomonas jatrophae]SFR98114.1 UDP-N-acetylglucosamine 2-epimerase (non-hydrolysing) [Sphingomonas jatrophae]